jgi:hypothetical protein
MYRVELKVLHGNTSFFLCFLVPNIPCGVERRLLPKLAIVFPIRFLMYRMELKE